MENPATWNDTQHKISKALSGDGTDVEQAQRVLAVLGETSLTEKSLVSLMRQHQERMDQGFYGLSIVSQIWNAHRSDPMSDEKK